LSDIASQKFGCKPNGRKVMSPVRVSMTRKALLLILGAALTLAAPVIAEQRPPARVVPSAKSETAVDRRRWLDLFDDALDLVRKRYVEIPTDERLIEAAINGMLSTLEDSRYIGSEPLHRACTASCWVKGTGIDFTMRDGRLTVVSPYDGSPAARANIMAGDIITHVDDEPADRLSFQQIADKLTVGWWTPQPINANVKLRIIRRGREKPLEISLVREELRQNLVPFRLEGDDIGYIRISQFDSRTTDGLNKAIHDLSLQVAPHSLRGYVIDLRNNPTGLSDEAITFADAFLESGEIVSIRGRRPEEARHFKAQPGDLANGKPIIVLINGGSASMAEIVAAALQDNKRATIVGTRSFGKGVVHTIIPVGPKMGAVFLATGHYFTPSGRMIQGKGITPDVEVTQDFPDELKTASWSGFLERAPLQSYIPPNPKDDRALNAAYDLLRKAKAGPRVAAPN
jgi:carboxyl-terminal processing protease